MAVINKKKRTGLYQKIREIRSGEPCSITYYFDDGSALSQRSVNSEITHKVFRGKRQLRTPDEIIKIFEDTKFDLGAKYYIID